MASPAPRHDQTLSGSVEDVRFHSADSGFAVLRVRVRGRHDPLTVVGTIPEVRQGQWLVAQGHWTTDPRHGRQFRAETLRTAQPDTTEGIERYLASGLVEGIGGELARRLVAKFGSDVFDVIENAPKRLRTVEGIGPKRAERIRTAWSEQKAVRDIMVFLHSHGISTNRAHRIFKQYGERSIEIVTENPYCLARDIWGIGFRSADEIAHRLGIAPDAPVRARAGLEHVLHEASGEGHCALPADDLARQACETLGIPADAVEQATAHLLATGRLVRRTDQQQRDLIYLAAMDRLERELAARLALLARGRHPCPKIDIPRALAWVQSHTGLALADQQQQALAMAVTHKIMVLTGGPGVGKTTLVDAILRVLTAKRMRVLLCAPTGRAAKRLSQATRRTATTIHRMLVYNPATGGFKHDEDNPLDADVIIVDETSMVDLPLACHVARAVARKSALLLVGDVDQLPSVGPGSVLRDVIDSDAAAVCRLTEVFRQAAESHIITNAHRVNHGQMPEFSPAAKPTPAPPAKPSSDPAVPTPSSPAGRPPHTGDFFFARADEPDKAVALILRLVQERIPKRFGLDPLGDVQVLTPMRRGTLGAGHLNDVLQAALNPGGQQLQRHGCTYRVADKVMQTRNNYDKEVFNGDIGQIEKIDKLASQLTVRFEDRAVPYGFRELHELVLSYATTIHKSQGSEFPAVVVPVHTQHYVMLQRNLLYTAITRGKQLVVLVGTNKAIRLAVGRIEAHSRITTLAERIRHASQLDEHELLPLFEREEREQSGDADT